MEWKDCPWVIDKDKEVPYCSVGIIMVDYSGGIPSKCLKDTCPIVKQDAENKKLKNALEFLVNMLIAYGLEIPEDFLRELIKSLGREL